MSALVARLSAGHEPLIRIGEVAGRDNILSNDDPIQYIPNIPIL